MGDNFTVPTNPDPPVPPGADQFDVPVPNFRLIGQMLGSGLKDSGFSGSSLTGVADWLITFLTTVIGALLSLLLCVVAFLIDLVNRNEEAAAPGIDAVASKSLANVLGSPIGGNAPGKASTRAIAGEAAAELGKQITDALVGGLIPGQPITPSKVPSEAFLGKLARFGITGWMEGLFVKAASVNYLDEFMELVPIMSDTLGLGRLSRRVLAPPLKILVEDPYTWRLNLDYRPALLAHDQACREFLRQAPGWDRARLDDVLGRQGFGPSAIDALLNINSKLLSLGDVDYLVARNHWSNDRGMQELQNDGYAQDTARILLELAGQRRLDVYNAELLALYVAAFERGEIDQGALHDAFTASTLPDGEIAVAEAIAAVRRQLNVKHLTLGEVETLIKAHVMSLDDLRAWMTRENYPQDEQTLLELWLFGKITSADQAAAAKKAKADAAAAAKAAKVAAAQAKQDAAAAKAASKGMNLATLEQLVELGQRTFDDLRAFLTAQGDTPAAIADIVDLLHAKISAKATLEQLHSALTAEADTRHVPLATTEKAVLAGTLTMNELDAFLHTNEYAAGDILIIEQYVQAQLDAAKAKAGAKSTATAAAAEKDISLPELERAARLGLITVQQYSDALDAAGFASTDRDIIVGILRDQITADTTTLAKRKAASAKATKKHISLAALEKSVIAGIRPMSDYQSELSLLGYDATDQASLVELLQLQIDHAKDVATKHAAAAAKMGARNVSLADLEAAVKLGVTSINDYKAQLAIDGWSAADIELLATSLLDELAAARAKKKISALPGQSTPAPAPQPGP